MIQKHNGIYVGIEKSVSDQDLTPLITERLPKVEALIEDFISQYEIKYGIKVSSIEDGANKLCNAYFYMVHDDVKYTVEDKINRFKMGSIMELLIVRIQVLQHPDSKENRKLNSLFALCSGLSLINSMVQHDKDDDHGFYVNRTYMNATVENNLKVVLKNHLIWLESKPIEELPIFINAHFHEVVELMASASYEQL